MTRQKHKLSPYISAGILIVVTGCSINAEDREKRPPRKDTPAVTASPIIPVPEPHDEHVGRKPTPSSDALKALPPDGGRDFNRLVFEKSPYLLQHASNPVDWYPWGQDAFDKARRENKPIFLSVGYSTCHWCHVMERESFEMRAIGEVLNKYFVSIKVDREERPDVDRVYMTYVQATSGGGGWPMSVWLTPDLKPFYAGTYFPPNDGFGRPGFKSVLLQLAKAWDEQGDKIQASGDDAIKQLQRMSDSKDDPDLVLQKSLLQRGYDQIMYAYEPQYGGFGKAPKFPRPVMPLYVLRHYYRHGDKAGLDAVLHTLRKMADGGMHDHIGKGFARYSVDERWHVPHFEKMLYDQGQLVPLYIEAYQITGDNVYADTARDVLGYVQRDMTGEHGQFYSAEDADSPLPENPSEQAEGAFYVWEKGQIDAALGEDAASIFNMIYGVEAGGNVRSDPHNEFHNKNVLIVEHTIDEAATKFNRSPSDVRALVDASLDKLFHIRERRPRPHLDDKTITAWNGLMISAFARAYTVLGDPSHLASAQKAAAFIRERLYDEKTHTLQRRFRAGESAIEGYVDDYAFFIQALLDLYDASFDTAYLAWAVHLQDTQDRVFWDTQEGGYFSTSGEDASILLRMKETYDGAEPSPNSIAAMNLLRLAQIFGDVPYLAKAQQTFMQMGAQLKSSPSATPQMMSALDFFLHKPKQVVIAGRPDADDTKAMLAAARAEFIPNRIILLADGGAGQAFLAQKQEFMKDVKPLDGKATAHVCENYVCQLPTTDLKVMMQQLKNLTADE